MNLMIEPQELLPRLLQDDAYQQWKKEHPQSFLSHYFCQLDSSLLSNNGWEIGFYDPAEDKITTFTDDFALKPADEIFKKENDKVEELDLEKVKIDFKQASKIYQDNFPKYFSQEQVGDGFLVLQCLQEKVLWNFTFITKSVKFVNLKINASNGEIESHDTVELVDKGK